MRYYHKHLLIACAISLLTLSPIAGAMLYVGREHHTWEAAGKKGWDKHGLLWPLVPLGLLHIVWELLVIIHILEAVWPGVLP